jgi:hypothetical protein
MSVEQRESNQQQDVLSYQEGAYFAEADVDAVLESIDPSIIKDQQVVVYPYNKTSAASIDAAYLKKLKEAIDTDNAIRAAVDAKKEADDPSSVKISDAVEVWARWLKELVLWSRANIETVNKSEVDIDEATWQRYEQESEKYVDTRIDDPRYRDNLTLAYARRQELLVHIKDVLWYQWKVTLLPPVVLFAKTEYQDGAWTQAPLDEATYTQVPWVTLRATYREFKKLPIKFGNILNGRQIIDFDGSDLEVTERDEKWRPTKITYGNEIFTLYGLWYKRGEKWMPLFTRTEVVQDEHGDNTTKDVEYYMDFSWTRWMDFIDSPT